MPVDDVGLKLAQDHSRNPIIPTRPKRHARYTGSDPVLVSLKRGRLLPGVRELIAGEHDFGCGLNMSANSERKADK
jgi:hypothetical protein